MTQETRPNPSDLWMPLVGIETPRQRAAKLRSMLANVPWEQATVLYGGHAGLAARVTQMRAELATLEREMGAEGEDETEAEVLAVIAATEYTGRAYVGVRPTTRPGDARVYVIEGETRAPLTHYPYHSPDGFEWGYTGSGPADLALALLADVLGEAPTRETLDAGRPLASWLLHQDLKADLVAGLPRPGWRVNASEIGA